MPSNVICSYKLIKLTFNLAGQFNHLNKLLLLYISTLTLQGDLSVNSERIDIRIYRRSKCDSLCHFSLTILTLMNSTLFRFYFKKYGQDHIETCSYRRRRFKSPFGPRSKQHDAPVERGCVHHRSNVI